MHHITAKETVGAHLYAFLLLFSCAAANVLSLTIHNVHFMLTMMGNIRQAIMEDKYPEYLCKFFSNIYEGDKSKYPEWAVSALRGVGVDLLANS
jgi:queuine tRNA-ribosyltransferase